MKLYVFRPGGHGQLTFMVCAKNEEEARVLTQEHIDAMYRSGSGRYIYDAQGWSTDYYALEVYEPGQVVENDNN
jgi:hypothetical protein